jgi:hypothetical protein
MSSGRAYNHSGVMPASFEDIDPYSTVTIDGVGEVNILGTIGKGTVVIKKGVGELNIAGIVEDNVKFKINSVGKVKFLKRPPQSVIDQIEKSGVGDLFIPGGWQAKTPDSDLKLRHPVYSDFSVVNNNGFITITQDGVKRAYKGNSVTMNGNKLIIDGKIVNDKEEVAKKESLKDAANAGLSEAELISSFSNIFKGSNISATGIAPGAKVGVVENITVSAFEISRYGK